MVTVQGHVLIWSLQQSRTEREKTEGWADHEAETGITLMDPATGLYSHSPGSPPSALRGPECSLCLCAGHFLLPVCSLLCSGARVQAQDPHLRVHAHEHERWVCAPECVKQTWERNWWQQCKNRGNSMGQWERRVHTGPPGFLSSLCIALPRSLRLVTGSLGWMGSYSYSNCHVTLWASAWKRGTVSRLLECTSLLFFWTPSEAEEAGGREREGKLKEEQGGEQRWENSKRENAERRVKHFYFMDNPLYGTWLI